MKLRLDSVIQDSFLMFFVYRFSSVAHLFFFAGSTAPLFHCSVPPQGPGTKRHFGDLESLRAQRLRSWVQDLARLTYPKSEDSKEQPE
jgi:hypothetical protein